MPENAAVQGQDTQILEPEPLKLDYTIESPSARRDLVEKIIAQTPSEKLTPKFITALSDYIIFAMDKEERKNKYILTDNHMVTVNKREMSFEGLVEKFENGEDGIYGLIANDKNIIFTPKISISEQDIENIPALKDLVEAIKQVEQAEKYAKGRKRYLLRKQLIEMRKDQYVIRSAYVKPITFTNVLRTPSTICFDESIEIQSDGTIKTKGFSLMNPEHVSIILCNYSKIKQYSYDKFESDSYYLILDIEKLVDNCLKEDFPHYFDLLVYKIDGKTNEEIQKILKQDYGIEHSAEYLSSLWRNKIPKMIAEYAQKEYLTWYYTFKERGKWKKCSKCGQIKLAHNMNFSKNNTSKDGYYSICKCCRNAKTKIKIQKKGG